MQKGVRGRFALQVMLKCRLIPAALRVSESGTMERVFMWHPRLALHRSIRDPSLSVLPSRPVLLFQINSIVVRCMTRVKRNYDENSTPVPFCR